MKHAMITGFLLATSLMVTAAWAEGSTETFLTKAVEGNLAEIEMGKLAQQNTASDAVKAYGKMLETDHSMANDEAIKVAASKGVKVPTAPNKDQQKDLKMLKKYAGAEFDKRFVPMTVDDHEKDIKLYQDEAKLVEDGAVATYAQQTLPTLQKHLQQAMALKNGNTDAK